MMFNEEFKHLAFNPKTFIMVAWSSTMIFAWVALFVMSIGWVRDHRVSRMWPIRGTVAGAISAISMFPQSIVVTLPAIVLAVILVRFHMREGTVPQ